jgi:hypothetical protein
MDIPVQTILVFLAGILAIGYLSKKICVYNKQEE